MHDNLYDILDSVDMALNTKRKRHIVGGVLLSASFLFAGLAITAMTISLDNKEEQYDDEQY